MMTDDLDERVTSLARATELIHALADAFAPEIALEAYYEMLAHAEVCYQAEKEKTHGEI